MAPMAQNPTSSVLGGATTGAASGGVRASGLMAGASTSGPAGGAATPTPSGGGMTAFALAGGGQSAPTAQGGTAAPAPNGSIGRVGLWAGTLAPHAHENAATGGVIDYARVVVSPTAPPAPASPSDAFWLNPEEEA